MDQRSKIYVTDSTDTPGIIKVNPVAFISLKQTVNTEPGEPAPEHAS